MAGGVDQVQHIVLTIIGLVVDTDGVGLDGNAAFALDIHAVEQLFFHLAIFNGARLLDEAVSEGGFPVVDVGHDGEIADLGELCHR